MKTRLCPVCGGSTPERYPHCGHCGTRLAGEQAAAEIRRFATVVNSDLKGSTALGEKLDPESLREVLTLYFDEMRLVFESHGGTIEKIIGDAIVAVFGVPVRHDDDALRAVEAAAESQRALASLNDRLEQVWGVRLVVRTGIATGDVLFGEASLGQHVLTGDTMRISSAMEQSAPPLEVLVAGSTIELVRDRVVVEAMPPVTPRGMAVTVPSYRLISVAPRTEAGHERADTAALGQRLCPACGEENPNDFRACGTCGASLAIATPARESRKTVTIVFADPRPTTLRGTPPSPEAMRDVMSRYFDAMRAALERHGGTVERFIGDAVMAVYGLPARHEDDAVRAIRAAAEMQAALPELNASFRAQWGLELRQHIGVNTGEVIAGDAALGQRLVTGDAVNTAARLEQAAGAQEVVLGELTYRLARDQVEAEPIPPLTLKGKAEPVPAYRLVRVQARPVERASAATPFVGRETELAWLDDALLDASGHAGCRLRVVVGDAGVGKSRLIREFATSAATGATVVRGRCLPYGDGITFWPIGEIVRRSASIADEDDATTAVVKIRALVAEETHADEDAGAIAERIAAAVGLSTVQLQLPELFWGIRKLLEALARRRPLVVIIDDVHSAAPAFLELLDHLVEAVAGAPILLVTTARHELLEAHEAWSAAHEAERLTLEPLDSTHAAAIVERLLDGLDETVRARVVAAAEGNPLYVEQISSMLIETGAIRRESDRWVPAAASGDVSIPPTIQALVAARLDALRPDERAVVEPASVIGLSFPRGAVDELVEVAIRPNLGDVLGSLTTKQLVRPATGAASIEDDTYRFGHLVIKDTAYGSLLKRIRAALHQRFVDWAERANRETGRETEFEEIHGYHLEQAYRYLTELAPPDDEARRLGRRAAEKLASAGRRALARSDMASATDLLRRAVDLLPVADPLRVELLPELSEAQGEHGDEASARSAATSAVDEAASLGDDRLTTRAALARLYRDVWAAAPRPEGAPDPATEVAAIVADLERAGDDASLARAWRVAAMLASKAGRFDDAAAAAERMIDHAAAAGDRRLVARGAAGYANQAVYGSQPVGDVLGRLEQLLALVEGDRKADGRIALELAQLHAMQGDFVRARELIRRGRSLIEDLGPSLSAMTTSIQASRVELLAGDPAAAAAALEQDDARLAAVGETYYRSTISGMLAGVALDLGRTETAERYCSLAEEIADEDDSDSQILWRLARSRILLAAGDTAAADRLTTEAVALAAEGSDPVLQADVLVARAGVLEVAAGLETAEPPLREALRRYEIKGDVVSAERVRAKLDSDRPSARVG